MCETIKPVAKNNFEYYFDKENSLIEILDSVNELIYRLSVDENSIKLFINNNEKYCYIQRGWDYVSQQPYEYRVHYTEIELDTEDYIRYATLNRNSWSNPEPF